MKQINTDSISNLLDVMSRLRDPQSGCPWDLEQTFATIAPYTIEEAYEVADVIERGATDELRLELGDLLFQVVFHARMAEEAGLFDFSDVAAAVTDKLIRRHPHVFAGADRPTDQTADWEAHKRAERSAAGASGVLAGVPAGLPALSRAAKIGKRAASVGFDWPDAEGARAKVSEELQEVDGARATGEQSAIEAEIGDLLFAAANLARHLGVDPEQALRRSIRRFETRFARVEERVADDARDWREYSAEEFDHLWETAKSEAAE